MSTSGPHTSITVVPHTKAKERSAEGVSEGVELQALNGIKRGGERERCLCPGHLHHHRHALRQSQGEKSGRDSRRVESLKP